MIQETVVFQNFRNMELIISNNYWKVDVVRKKKKTGSTEAQYAHLLYCLLSHS